MHTSGGSKPLDCKSEKNKQNVGVSSLSFQGQGNEDFKLCNLWRKFHLR